MVVVTYHRALEVPRFGFSVTSHGGYTNSALEV
jgi:hypothetical protein